MKYVVTNFMIIIAVICSFMFASFSFPSCFLYNNNSLSSKLHALIYDHIYPDDLTKCIRRERLAKIIPALYTVAFRRKNKRKLLCFTDIVNRTERLHPTTSCSALLIKHPSTTSGWYYINPQELGSSSLVQVYCDMTSKNGVGVTVIGHDSESRTLVMGYEAPGSYKRTITYDISMQQIVAIMRQSKNCEQFIKYECHHSFFKYQSVSYGWWVSRQGSKMNYWGGAAVNSGKCACGMTNTCAGGGKCNCDRNDQAWREDSGYLTDENTLPVTELRFGDTGHRSNGERGYHTLGKLRCWI